MVSASSSKYFVLTQFSQQGHQVGGVISSILQENIESQRGAEVWPSFKAGRWCGGKLPFGFKGGQEGSTVVQDRGISQKAIAIVPVKDSNGLCGVCEYVWRWGGGGMEGGGWSQGI